MKEKIIFVILAIFMFIAGGLCSAMIEGIFYMIKNVDLETQCISSQEHQEVMSGINKLLNPL